MLTVTDLFCGAGGSSSGAVQVPGVRVRMAANHWALAVETHNTNHPETDHDTADISQVDPRRYPRTDILWASPECTNHSVAKGRRRVGAQPDLFGELLPDEAAERSRATMWDVVRFAEHHAYRAIIVENVVEVTRWVLWRSWAAALSALGYEHRVVSLNSMHAQGVGPGAPQSRDRVYIVAWRKGERAPDLDRWTRPRAECAAHGTVRAMQAWKSARLAGKFRQQYVYRCPRIECRHSMLEPVVRPAADAIDWTLAAVRIADRPRQLSVKTMARIVDGYRAYGQPIVVPSGGTWNETAYPVDVPFRARTTRESEGVAVPPLVVPVEGREGKQARPASEPLRTCTARNETGIAVAPYVVELRGGGSKHRAASHPLSTVTAGGNHHGLVPGGAVASPEELAFRMLVPDEYRAAMAFPGAYLLLGTRREQVRLAGNAVTPPAARDLIAAVAEAITKNEIPVPAEGFTP
ncbi:MAG: DNA cytosine methyltransferase [Micromonosporaceae bacterium]